MGETRMGRRGALGAAAGVVLGAPAFAAPLRITGPIGADTLARLEAVLPAADAVSVTGEGGDWRVAMAMGRRLRDAGVSATAVGEACHDACLLVVLGAEVRAAAPGTSLWLQLPGGRALREEIGAFLRRAEMPEPMVARLLRQEPLSGQRIFVEAGMLRRTA